MNSTATIWKIRVLSLYKSILKIHKLKLSKDQLYIGNKYVQSEFKLHKNADKKQVFFQGDSSVNAQ